MTPKEKLLPGPETAETFIGDNRNFKPQAPGTLSQPDEIFILVSMRGQGPTAVVAGSG